MPTYMDVHSMDGSSVRRQIIVGLTRRSGPRRLVRRQLQELGSRCNGKIFCLVDCSLCDTAVKVHREGSRSGSPTRFTRSSKGLDDGPVRAQVLLTPTFRPGSLGWRIFSSETRLDSHHRG